MKVVHIAGSISRKAGGLFNSVRRLAQEERSLGCEVQVLGAHDEFSDKDVDQWAPLKPRVYAVQGSEAFGFSGEIKAALDEWMPDVVHLHGLWQYPSYAVSKWARSKGAKYVVSPRGMLDTWALHNSGWKKRLAGALYEKRSLRGSACIHALTEKEACDIRNYGVDSPVCVIPNGVDLQEPGVRDRESERENGARTLLYIGRLHPKKGLESLLRAWSVVRKQDDSAKDWKLIIAGWGDGDHEMNLRKLAGELGVEDSVEFPGSVYGDDKDAFLNRADAFILPSLSEGLPMSVLEAWAYGLPVLMTKECNLPQGFLRNGAMAVEADHGSISGGLAALFAMSEDECKAMGLRGKAIAEEEFAWRRQAARMLSVYNWLLSGEDRPSCVVGSG